jgi:hypothetical protein
MRVPSGAHIQHIKKYYFKSNGSLKYDSYSFFKNLEEVYERETNNHFAREMERWVPFYI